MNTDIITDKYHNTYSKITNKYKTRFGITPKLIKLLHKSLYNLYSNSNSKNIVKPRSIHYIINNLFINEYYPIVSRNYNINNKTMAVIMGTQAFNMNIPNKLKNILYKDTDDIDLKIYTTELHYNKSSNTNIHIKNVLSLFRYIIITLLFFMKQIIAEIIEYTNNIFVPTISHYKEKKLKYSNKTKTNKTKTNKTKTKTNKTKKLSQKGGIIKTLSLIKHNKTNYGMLKHINIILQIKKPYSKETTKETTQEDIDITNLSYDEIYNLVFLKINDIDILITTKIKYKIYYSKLLKKANFQESITFSDTKIYYPNMFENTTFYAYYLLNNKARDTLDTLYKKNIDIEHIIKLNKCGNNCNYIAIKSLQIDLIIMLQYAEFINNENYDNNYIIVPISALFKYSNYFIKYISLSMIIKFYNKTLNKYYMYDMLKLFQYIKTKITDKTNIKPEITPKNIIYKKNLNDFHQAFFIKQTMFPEYEIFRECVDDYNNIKQYINKSRLLFTDLYKKYNKINDINFNNNSLLNVLHYVINENQNENASADASASASASADASANGGGKKKIKSSHKMILYEGEAEGETEDYIENNGNVIEEYMIINMFNTEIENIKKIIKIL